MGWLWSSPSSAATNGTTIDKPAPPPTQSTTQPPLPSQSTPSKPAPTRAELEEAELQSFLKDIDLNVTKPESSTKYKRSSTTSSSPSTPASALNDPNAPLAEQLLPTTMSCRQAFDTAFYCNSLGGRFNDVYRYGTIKSCSGEWSDFWFCMRTRTQSSPSKELAIREHYRRKEELRYGRGGEKRESSEDVWQSRESKVPVGEAFRERYVEFEGSDEEWREEQRRWREGAKGE